LPSFLIIFFIILLSYYMAYNFYWHLKIVVFSKGILISTQLHTNHFVHALCACGCYSHGQWNHEGRKMCFLTRTTNPKKKTKEEDTTKHKVNNPCMGPFHFLSSTFSFPRQPTPTNYAPLLSPTKPSNVSTMWRWFWLAFTKSRKKVKSATKTWINLILIDWYLPTYLPLLWKSLNSVLFFFSIL
jgi:hypothetical protein